MLHYLRAILSLLVLCFSSGFLVGAKSSPSYNPGPMTSPIPQTKNLKTPPTIQYDDTNQSDQSFFLSEVEQVPSKDSPPSEPSKYFVVGRSDSKGVKYIQLVNLIDPETGTWNGTQNATVSDTLSNNIWGWTADEMSSVVYTLEAVPSDSNQAIVHAYIIQAGKFVEQPMQSMYYKAPIIQSFGKAWSIRDGNNLTLPTIGMAYLDGQIFFADGDTIASAEDGTKPFPPTCSQNKGIIPGRACFAGYEWPSNNRWLKTLSTIATPGEGNLLIASSPTGNIVVAKYNDTSKMIDIVFDNSAAPVLYDFRYPSNFKMIPIQRGETTFYSLTFVANEYDSKSKVINNIRKVFYLPIVMTGDNTIDWEATFRSENGQPGYNPQDDAKGIFHNFDTAGPNVNVTPAGFNALQTVAAKSLAQIDPATGQVGTQYTTTLYYKNREGRDTGLTYGSSKLSAYLAVVQAIDNSEVFGTQVDRKISDNVIGIIYGTPPLYSSDLRESENKVTIGWDQESSTGKSNGFSVDSSLKVGFSMKENFIVFSLKAEQSFSIFGGYKKNLSTVHSIKTSVESTQLDSSSDTDAWANNTGWLIVSRGYASYDAYRLAANIKDSDDNIMDRSNPQRAVAVLSIIPSASENNSLLTEAVSFNLTTGEIKGASDNKKIFNWDGYAKGLKFPGDDSIFHDDISSGKYWLHSSFNDIKNEVNSNSVDRYVSSPLPVGLRGNETQVKYIESIENSKETEGYIGGEFERKTGAGIFGIGGNIDFKISSQYDYRTNSSMTESHDWSASTATKKVVKDSVNQLIVTMNLLKPSNQTKNKPFWIPQWSWDKGNRPWLITWTATYGAPSISQPALKKSKKL